MIAKPLSCVLLLCLFYFTTDTIAETAETIAPKMAEIDRALAKEQTTAAQLSREIQFAAQKVNSTRQELEETQKQLQLKQAMLQQLSDNKTKNVEQSQMQRELLSTELQRAYVLSYLTPWQVVLGSDQTADIPRWLGYYRYLAEARRAQLQSVQIQVNALQKNKNVIERQQVSVKTLLVEQQKQQNALTAAQKRYEQLWSELQEKLNHTHQQVQQLQENKRALEAVLHQLSKEEGGGEKFLPVKGGFSKQKGYLQKPISGKIIQHFGEILLDSDLKSSGVLIQTAANSEVRAVFRGKIVFADQLKGFGWLVIVDHGGDYMTLYGRNARLTAKVNQVVAAGDVIATMGDQEPSDAYFEIRKDGKPLNPEKWFRQKQSIKY